MPTRSMGRIQRALWNLFRRTRILATLKEIKEMAHLQDADDRAVKRELRSLQRSGLADQVTILTPRGTRTAWGNIGLKDRAVAVCGKPIRRASDYNVFLCVPRESSKRSLGLTPLGDEMLFIVFRKGPYRDAMDIEAVAKSPLNEELNGLLAKLEANATDPVIQIVKGRDTIAMTVKAVPMHLSLLTTKLSEVLYSVLTQLDCMHKDGILREQVSMFLKILPKQTLTGSSKIPERLKNVA